MMAGSDITVEILKEIRDDMRGLRTELREEVHGVRTELREEIRGLRSEQVETNSRLDTVEATLLDLAQQQRFVVRYTKALSERDARLEPRVRSLEERVDKLETK